VPLSCNLRTLTSWNPLGHSRPVTGELLCIKKKEVKITYRNQRKRNIAKEQGIKGNPVLLGSDAASFSKWFPVFRHKVVVSSSRVDLFIVEMDISTLKLGPLGYLEKLVSNYRAARLHTLEEVILQLHRCKSLTGQCTYNENLWRVRVIFIPPRPS
jgi:hypothetical protein